MHKTELPKDKLKNNTLEVVKKRRKTKLPKDKPKNKVAEVVKDKFKSNPKQMSKRGDSDSELETDEVVSSFDEVDRKPKQLKLKGGLKRKRNEESDEESVSKKSKKKEKQLTPEEAAHELYLSIFGNVASTSDDGIALCCEAAVANEGRKIFADVWLFDMGASFHMTTRREWFHQYKPISGGKSVYSCNDHELKIIGIRSVMVKIHDDDLGCKVEIQNKIMKIIKGMLVLMKGEKVAANLYQLKGEIMEEAEASVASHSPSNRLQILIASKAWTYVGTRNEDSCREEANPVINQGYLYQFYEYCVINKQHRLKFNASNSRSVSILELAHSDVWQMLGVPNQEKSDVFEVFKEYKARVKLDSGKKIKCLRTYNGGEYTGDEFDLFCRQEGIKSLGKSFWAEVVNTACYVINRSPSTMVELKTPMEMWTGKPVNYSDLHIFGSPIVKGYCLWDPTAYKVVVNKDVVFMEDKIQEIEEGDSTTR
ncbi:gag-pol polyprotein [Tanacetum coccineum]